MFDAQSEFGLQADPTNGGVGGGAPSSLPAVAAGQVSSAWSHHPTTVLAVVAFATAGLLGYASFGAGVHERVGKEHAEIEGQL